MSYSSVRQHLDTFIDIDFSKIPDSIASIIEPLKQVELKKNNLIDYKINAYDSISNFEKIYQIQNEVHDAINDIDAVLQYIKSVDADYYKQITSQASEFYNDADTIMTGSAPGFINIAYKNFINVWEAVSGVSKGIFEAIQKGAHGLDAIYNTTGGSISKLFGDISGKISAEGLGKIQAGEISQLITTLIGSGIELVDNCFDLYSTTTPEERLDCQNDILAEITKITDASLQLSTIYGGTSSTTVTKIVVWGSKSLALINDIKSLHEDLTNIDSLRSNNQLSALSNNFLKDAYWIKASEGFDALSDFVGLMSDIAEAFPASAYASMIVSYCTEAAVTASDAWAISQKNQWSTVIDQFEDYAAIVPLISNFQQDIAKWISYADNLSHKIWGDNLTPNIPAASLPVSSAMDRKYSGWLEEDNFGSGSQLNSNTLYNGKIGWFDPGDWFTVKLQAGKDYSFVIDGGSSLSSVDAALYSSSGVLLAYADYTLSDSNTKVISGSAILGGNYIIAATSSNITGDYTIKYTTTTPVNQSITELIDAPSSVTTPYALAVGQTIAFETAYNDEDWVKIQLTAGKDYRFELTRTSSYDSVAIYLHDALGNTIASPEYWLSGGSTSVIEGTVFKTGTYYISIDTGSTTTTTFTYTEINPTETITELIDAPSSITTPYTLAVGQTIAFETAYNDEDWVKIQLTAGKDYRFELTRTSSYDSVAIYLHDALGNTIASPEYWLSGGSTSVIEGTVFKTGTYYISIDTGSTTTTTFTYTEINPTETITELIDAPSSITTPYTLAVGQTIAFETAYNDEDWVKIQLTAGKDYRFELTRTSSYDSVAIYLHDALGNTIASPDAWLSSYSQSVIEGTAFKTGTYYISVDTGSTTTTTFTYTEVDLPSTVTELADAPASTATPYTLAVGQTFNGEVSYYNDDWVKVQLTAGKKYEIQLDSKSNYTEFALFDNQGKLFDSPQNRTIIDGIATQSGSYYIHIVSGTLDIYTINFTSKIIGTSNGDRLQGTSGNDFIDALAGNDILIGGLGNDTLAGGAGSDQYFTNLTKSGSFEDIIIETGLLKSDIDSLSISGYSDSPKAAINISSANLVGVENVHTGNSNLYSITGNALANVLTGNDLINLIKGGIGNDSVLGSGGADTLYGEAGNDSLIGGYGNDLLVGGVGKDTLTGLGDNDVFDFNSLTESGLTATTRDVITDFTHNQDRIDLSTLDANALTGGNAAFSFIGKASFSSSNATGQLRFDYNATTHVATLYGSTDADSAAEFSLQVTLANVAALVASDFIL